MVEDAYLSTTRAGYDAIAEPYAEQFRAESCAHPLDRALLAAFAELVGPTGGEILEVGSGPGEISAHLHRLGARVRGIDLSPAMVDLARREHPAISFEVGEMGALDVPDASVPGLIAWYSIIHVPAEHLPRVFAEFHRALRPGGHLLLAFQVGDAIRHRDEAYGREVSLDFRRLQPDAVAALLDDAGLDVVARLVREPDLAIQYVTIPQGFLLARRR